MKYLIAQNTQEETNMEIIFMLLWLSGIVLGLLFFYLIIKAAVKNGILEATKETDKKV